MSAGTSDNTRVYRETTISLPHKNKNKKQRHDKSDLGDNFIAPDGGWAWVVCLAAGCSNLVVYPCLQMFGLLFRERLAGLGMTSPEITSIINTNSAISSCTGLLNGPMFRRFTYRQVALAGSCFIFLGLMLTAFSETFPTYMLNYSLLYGFGMGISVSASSMALNTYFKQKRRKAAGLSWAFTGLGPIIFPYVITTGLPIFGVQGTVIIFASFSLHTVVSALIYQPVKYHAVVTRSTDATEAMNMLQQTADQQEPMLLCKHCELQREHKKNSSYLVEPDDMIEEAYNITAPGTPMLARANDGWYGSKLSLTSSKMNFRTVSSCKDMTDLTNNNNLTIKRINSAVPLSKCCCHELKQLPQVVEEREIELITAKNMTISQKIVVFFDLDLLKDFTYLNLVIGLTIINFGELNFSILTPFILHDFGLDNRQITIAMSLLASMDITMRFLTPFFTAKINWDNRIFLIGAFVCIACGRTVVACTRSYTLILICFVWIGFFKGIRTVFWPLIIPGIVPLKRLPAATGLQLLISGLFGLATGPLVGLIRDEFNYSVCLHFLNFMTFLAAVLWSLEAFVRHVYRGNSGGEGSEMEQKLNQQS